jgi:hypothetical protein
MTLVLLPLVVLGAIVAWAAGARPRSILVGVLAASVLLLVSSVVLVGAVAVFEDDDDDPAASALDVRDVDARVQAVTDDGRFAEPRRPIDGLVDGESRLIEVTGLPSDDTVLARQCRTGDRVCDPSIPARVDRDGNAVFLFEFRACDECSLVLTDDEAGRLVSVPLVFGVAVPPAAIELDRSSALTPGDVMTVTLTDFTPGTYTVTFCTPPGPVDPASCGRPAPEVTVEIDASGAATVELPVYEGPVGIDRDSCSRGNRCAVAVPGRADVAVVPFTFAGSADANPGTLQMVLGFATAAVLLAVALVWMRRGPWTPPDGDPFAGIELVDPFVGLEDDEDDDEHEDDQPATSRRRKRNAPVATSATR